MASGSQLTYRALGTKHLLGGKKGKMFSAPKFGLELSAKENETTPGENVSTTRHQIGEL